MIKIIFRLSYFLLLMPWLTGYCAENQTYKVKIHEPSFSKDVDFVESEVINVTCGHIKGIINIPEDWDITIVRLMPGSEKLEGKAGHGATRLRNLSGLNDAVLVTQLDEECFHIAVDIHISGGNPRTLKLNRPDVELVPDSK